MTNDSIDVIVPIYKGLPWLEEFFATLTQQTLDRGRFRLVCVFNGPDDGASSLLRKMSAQEPSLNLTVAHEPTTGACRARQRGIELATAPYVTFLDVDDLLAPTYLEQLLAHAGPDKMSVGLLVDLEEDGGNLDFSKSIPQDLLNAGKRILEPSEYRRAFSFMTAKAFPREWATEASFPEDLASGEDVAFYGRVLSRNHFTLDITPGLMGATYYRRVVANSVSRGRTDFDFMVRQRALVIQDLGHSARMCTVPNSQKAIVAGMSAQASFIRRYIDQNLHEYQGIADYLVSLAIPDFPWQVIVPPAEDLVIAYNFLPYSDTGAVVAAKRIREAARPVDVISNSMSSRREIMRENLLLAQPYLASHKELEAPTSFNDPNAIAEFVRRGLEQFAGNQATGRRYTRIYSRSMWPASHFLAAAIKKIHPEIHWKAEFSDPVQLTVTGDFRKSPLEGTDLYELTLRDLPDTLYALAMAEPDLYAWTELLPYGLADEVVFTNENQQEIMLGYAQPSLRTRIRAVSSISHHPTLPRTFYELMPADPGVKAPVRIGYFGEFYATRGLREVLSALDQLPEHDASLIELHIFSTESPFTALEGEALCEHTLQRITWKPKVSYLHFLGLLDQFDILLVNDATTQDHHSINPYLPSKYSDYRGAFAKIWALVEEGSVLSKIDTDYSSTVGDPEEALATLQAIVDDTKL